MDALSQPLRPQPGNAGHRCTLRIVFGSALVALAMWACFTWPLPREVRSGIPYAARVPGEQVCGMLPGDHLQLLYHFWLFEDMLRGGTPWFHNLYEFNTGDDAARREPGTYYLPFSGFFALGDSLAGRAFGWNFAGFCALWLGYAFSVLLARRYTTIRGVAWVAALPCLMLPFRWDALLGGSPLGFAMMWIPALFLGLDLAVRESRVAGGVLAGVALIGACIGDLHVLAFAFLATPVVCCVALLIRPGFRWTRWRDYTGIAVALIPVVLAAIVVAALRHAAHSELASSSMSVGRDLREVTLFSPNWKGLFLRRTIAISNQIYIGYVIPLCIALGAVAILRRRATAEARDWRSTFLLLASLSIGVVVIVLALGPRDPLGGDLFKLVRKLIPPYAMIRQPAKIFCLVPPLLTILLALSLGRLTACRSQPTWRPAVLAIVTALMLLDYRPLTRAGITRLQPDQQAYAAVARDATAVGETPRALVVALWPGDTHYTAIYQYFASRYHIRMVNGYSPVVSRDYKDVFFPKFASLNQGFATDAQLDDLRARGIEYFLVHEDLFPEKVSPFPITFTLRNLLNNPRLEFLTRDGPVWAFKIREKAVQRAEIGSDWTVFFPARHWEAEKCPHSGEITTGDATAAGGSAVHVHGAGDYVGIQPTAVAPAPGLRFLARIRGHGPLHPELLADTVTPPALANVDVDSPLWSWIEILAPVLDDYTQLGLKLVGETGTDVHVDALLLAAGAWDVDPALGETVSLPATVFFHAGHIDTNQNAVVFEHGIYAGGVWYGPNLPLERGTYGIGFDTKIDAPTGTQAGQLHVKSGDKLDTVAPVIAGQHTEVTFQQEDNRLLLVIFDYAGAVDVAVQRLTITRLPSP